MKLPYLFLLLVLFSPALAHAQTVSQPYAFNCNALQSPSEGCKSYNEMIVKKDKELMEFIENESTVYVCFRPEQDVFLFLGFSTPGEAQFKMGASGHLESSGQSLYFRYSDGVLEDSKVGNGVWTKFTTKNGPVFFTPEGSEVQSSISDSELSVSYTFPNLTHKRTNYSVTLRRSTLRFSEQYTFPQLPVPSRKGVKEVPPSETDNRLAYTGYCAQIKPSAYLFYPTSQQ
jgi:hypothetical protein